MDFKISKDDLQKIANYLMTRPWQEVNSLIQMIGQCKPISEETTGKINGQMGSN